MDIVVYDVDNLLRILLALKLKFLL